MKVGGQAVIEGIVMRNENKVAVAVRLPNGKIKIKSRSVKKAPWLFRKFFFRGIFGLILMLIDGMKYVLWSANQQLEKEEKIKTEEIVGTVIISVAFVLLLFVGLPLLLAAVTPFTGVQFTLFEGIVRGGIFVSYLAIISRFPDVKRMFQYHGAEHKSVHCFESGKPLNIGQVQGFTTLHPRCGTSFIFVVLIISVVVFSFIQGSWFVKIVGRILLVPVIGCISYELLRFGDKFSSNRFVKMMIAPGLWLQKITTQEPDDKQVEVGLAALKKVVG